ncbi:alkanesulfonate monooxygenase SsuD/methylene tetrahydromethanopterin reductase-like flavin-dependent oxidoreductase (luciferase family) [Thermocatellispora tengchongensis]|uniref:Alkanesulfonate monooxygenase SsuD/methylene tetrahydromethanopterin reductase-like flavin-dependent oxidoreductase (Luciferase family) n=1 Tax=Thermocatellispora tengchongensis TaxID=1073253 RepID=A0A840PWZ3_9ACTN|nr:LLM class flavin-dependent oxidoreductase [Thermocatellispora tengchongensis]MBB5140385.1 alkanesulfonate monooxygenase SsuD/methylene tetrahydromethanopterin reductase-like flavin-dependent oxidoreductase (luciferase family) [Thermocatellispora tengchongensis]
MTDYGHPITFGLSLDPDVDRLAETRRLAQAASDHGLDHLAVQDHAYQPGHLDAWTLITHLAAETERISFLTDVADLQLRPPTMLAKAAASLGVLTGGRIVLGLGGGAFADAIAGMGGVRRDGPAMVAFTEEALHVMRAALSGGPVRLLSDRHRIEGYAAGPVPPSPIPLWLGSQGPRMLAVTGRAGDGWISPLNIYVRPDEVPGKQKLIDDAARSAGRDPASIRRIYNVIGTIGNVRGGPGLAGDVRVWTDTLTSWAVELGFDTFIFWPVTAHQAQLDVFAAEVVPAVRERVSEIRGQR